MYFEFDVVGYMHTDKPSPSDNGGFVFSVTVSLRESGKRCWGDRGDQTDVCHLRPFTVIGAWRAKCKM